MNEEKLILVYNAHAGVFSSASDFVKKLTHPDRYDCQLCNITYGALKMQHPWKEYLNSLPYQKEFLYKNQFEKKFPDLDIALPAILLQCSDESLQVVVSSVEINQAKNLQQLIVTVVEKLALMNRPCGTVPQ